MFSAAKRILHQLSRHKGLESPQNASQRPSLQLAAVVDEPCINVMVVDVDTHELLWAQHNVITQTHRNLYAQFLKGDSITVPSHIAVGNIQKLATEDASRFTELKSEYARVALTSQALQSEDVARLMAVITADTATGEIDELALMNAAATSLAVHAMDVTTNWSSDGSIAAVNTVTVDTLTYDNREGTSCLQVTTTGNGSAQTVLDNSSLNVNATAYTTADYLQFWYFVDEIADLTADLTVRLYTGGSNYYQWTVDRSSTSVMDGVFDRAVAASGVSQVGGWFHVNLLLSDATTSGSPDITASNISRFTLLSTKTNTVSVVEAVDDIRMFSANGDMWARVEPPRMILKRATTGVGVYWFLSMRAGATASQYTAFAGEQLSVSTAAVSLTAATYNPVGADSAAQALVHVRSGGPINYRIDGTAPTATVGSGPVSAGQTLVFFDDNIANLQMIQNSGGSTATVFIEYLR